MTYALVGWKGAGEGEGQEAAAGVDGAPEAPSLSVLLRPDRQSRMRPVESESGSAGLTDLVLDPPTTAWPLAKECRRDGVPAGDPGATRALNWLPQAREETKEKLGLDPRAAYPVQPFDKAGWDGLVTIIHGVTWDDVPEAKRGTEFTQDQFLAGKCQLETELHLVGNVRDFLTHLASPIADTGLLAYSKVLRSATRCTRTSSSPTRRPRCAGPSSRRSSWSSLDRSPTRSAPRSPA